MNCSGVVIVNNWLLNMNSLPMLLLRSRLYFQPIICRENIIIAEVNADEDRVLADRFQIQSYPTLKFFPAGAADAPEEYEGGRTALDLVRFVNEKVGTKATVKTPVSNVKVLTPENFDEIVLNTNNVVFVKFYAPVSILFMTHP